MIQHKLSENYILLVKKMITTLDSIADLEKRRDFESEEQKNDVS